MISSVLDYKHGRRAIRKYGPVTRHNLLDILEYVTKLSDFDRMVQLYSNNGNHKAVTETQARIFMALLDGKGDAEIGREVGYNRKSIAKIRRKCKLEGIL